MIIIGMATAILTKYVSLGSIVFLIMVPIISLIFKTSNYFFITYLILAIIGILRHKENIKRLLNKTENKMGGARNE